MASTANTLHSLGSARDIVLRDHTLYTQVVPGVLPVISPAQPVELRRWGADFLAETFASQVATSDEKQSMSLLVLDTLRGYLNRKETMGEEEDKNVVKSAAQCAASIYPFVFRHTVNKPDDSETWGKIAAIKSSILRRMDTASPGVRICCIKFVASVVLAQTPGLIADPRRPEQNEISLALVPRDHRVIPPANLEAEASGLLDRLLDVLQDNISDALIVTATLNALFTLVQRRASISSKILTTVLGFNPLKLASKPMSGKDKIAVRSMTRTTMAFVHSCAKRKLNLAFVGRLETQVERLKHNLTEAFSENHQLKRPAPDEPTDGLDDAKRQRVEAHTANGMSASQQRPPTQSTLPSGPVSLAQVWTLTNDQRVATFNCARLPANAISQLILALASQIQQSEIDEKVNIIRSRWLNLERLRQTATSSAPLRPAVGDEDDDDYDPSLSFAGDTAQAANQLDPMPPNGISTDIAIAPYHLPPPPPLSDMDRQDYAKTALKRVFGTLTELEKDVKNKGKAAHDGQGLHRLAAVTSTGPDQEGWITLITRLATRTGFAPSPPGNSVKKEENGERSVAKQGSSPNIPANIREALLNYVMDDFRSRIGVAIAWLSEEWYSDRLAQKIGGNENVDSDADDTPNYWHWALRLLDAMVPYFDVKDKRLLIRFLSELPAVNPAMLDRVKKIAEDPERVEMSMNALLYLAMYRPPAREIAIDCAEQMWKDNKEAKSAAQKILSKWRPAALDADAEVKAEI